MNNDLINQFNDRSRESLRHFEKFNAINLEAMEKLAALQISFTHLNLASTAAQARILSDTTAPDVLFQAESALVREYGENLVKLGTQTTAVLTDSREKLVAFAKESFSAAADVEKPVKKTRTAKKTANRKVSKKTARKAS